jgi:hypothetical protein
MPLLAMMSSEGPHVYRKIPGISTHRIETRPGGKRRWGEGEALTS